jgi:hypothetical protein
MRQSGQMIVACLLIQVYLFGQEVDPRLGAVDASVHVRIQNPDQPGPSPAGVETSNKPFSGKIQPVAPTASQPNWNPLSQSASQWGPATAKIFPSLQNAHAETLPAGSSEFSGRNAFGRKAKNKVTEGQNSLAPAKMQSAFNEKVPASSLSIAMRRQARQISSGTKPGSPLEITGWEKESPGKQGNFLWSHERDRQSRQASYSLRHVYTSRKSQNARRAKRQAGH